MSTRVYTPDLWATLRLEANTDPGESGKDHIHYRVLASWYGGFASGDSWKMSSGIESCRVEDDHYVLPQTSGSTYVVHKNNHGMSGYSASVLHSYQTEADKTDELKIILLTEEEAMKYLEDLQNA